MIAAGGIDIAAGVFHRVGVIYSEAGGDMTLQWAQQASNATPTVMHAGSYIAIAKIAP